MKPIDLERELALHSESTIRAIESGRVDLARRRLTAYHRFAGAFLEAATNRGVSFSDEAALSVSFLEWPTPLQLAEYAKKGAIAAVGTQNSDLIREGAYLPLRFLELSVTHRDFLFYLEMSKIYPRFLSLAYEATAPGMKQQIVEMSWRPLSEFCRYQLVPLLRDHALDKAPSYISQTLWVISDLLDVAMDHSDYEAFSLLGRELDRLFDNIGYHRLSNADLQLLIEVDHNERQLVWFGLGAWSTHSRPTSEGRPKLNQPERNLLEETQSHRFFYEASRRFNTLGNLSAAYFPSLYRYSRGALWRRWVRDNLADGRPRRDIFDRLLDRFYCLAGLRLVMAGQNDPIGPHREAQFRRDSIKSFLDELQQSPELWTNYLPANETANLSENAPISLGQAIERFLILYDSSIRRWEFLREEQILQAPLDAARKESFRETCFSAWQQNSWFQALFRQMGRERSELAGPNAEYVNIRSLVPKEAFIADQDTSFFGLGESAGARLAGEVIDDFLSLLESHCMKLEPTRVELATTEVLARISGMEYPVIILIGNVDIQPAVSEHKEFVPSWRDATPEFSSGVHIGRLDNAPVFHVFDDVTNKVLIVDLYKSGILIHYQPPEHNYRGLQIQIHPIGEDDALALDREYPELKPESLSDSLDLVNAQKAVNRWFMLQVDVTVEVKLELRELDTVPGVVVPLI